MSKNLIHEFYEENKDTLNLPYSKVKNICESPFRIMKEYIDGGKLHDFTFTHLGKFLCNDVRLEYFTKSVEERYKKGIISEETYKQKLKNEEYQKNLREDYLYSYKYKKFLNRKH